MTTLQHTECDPVTRHFEARVIDESPRLLEESYRLRYQVYCLERRFLSAEDYPAGLEIDEFDGHSVHVGAVDRDGCLAGTARVVMQSAAGFPLSRHCTVFAEQEAVCCCHTVVEVSRLSVSRRYNRRQWDRPHGVEERVWAGGLVPRDRRRADGEVFLTVMKALYQASKRLGATHWLAATERSLHRILARHGFPFRRIGPETDYFGLVAPYVMDLREFDSVIASGSFRGLDEFVAGQEPVFWPVGDDAVTTPGIAAVHQELLAAPRHGGTS